MRRYLFASCGCVCVAELGRDLSEVYVVFAGLEPESFKRLFQFWEDRPDVTNLNSDVSNIQTLHQSFCFFPVCFLEGVVARGNTWYEYQCLSWRYAKLSCTVWYECGEERLWGDVMVWGVVVRIRVRVQVRCGASVSAGVVWVRCVLCCAVLHCTLLYCEKVPCVSMKHFVLPVLNL